MRIPHKASAATLCSLAPLAALLVTSAHASVVTTAQFSGSATTTSASDVSTTQTYTESGTEAFFTEIDPGQEISGANVVGTIETRTDGQLNFANVVGGIGRQSSATSSTSVKQVVTNTTSSAKDVSFSSLILPGALGLGLFNTDTCSNGSFFDCSETPTTRSVGDRGGPASAELSVQVLANGAVVFELDLGVSVTAANGGTSMFTEDVADGAAFNGFGLLGDRDVNNSLFYAWDRTDFTVNLGELEAGEVMNIEFLVETRFSNETSCSFETTCVSALSGFGDPIKGLGNVQTRSFSLQSFAYASEIVAAPEISFDGVPVDVGEPVPLPAGAWFMLAGLGGLRFARKRKFASAS